MSNLAKKESLSAETLDKVLVRGDLSALSDRQRIEYYSAVCKSVGLNPLTKPFEYIQLNGKLTLYALRAATDQLRSVHKVSINITNRELIEGVYIVTARAKDANGREDESTGAVTVVGLKGEALANAYMKAETKAKRRVTLSVCGLGLLDESEVESIPDAKPVNEAPKNVLADIRKEREVVESNPGAYRPTFGKFKGKTLNELDPYEVANYIDYIRDSASRDGKEIKGSVLEFLDIATQFIESKMERPAALELGNE